MPELNKNFETNQAGKSKKIPVFSIVLVLMVFVLVGVFAVKVIFLYDKMVRGEVVDLDLDYGDRLSTSQAIAEAAEQTGLVDVNSEDDPALGSDDPLLTVVEFADFGCPYSREVSYNLRRFANRYGSYVRFIYRDFPMNDIHPESQLAAEAAECAHEQGKFWEYHDKLYQNQNDLSLDALKLYALQIGLDEDEFSVCLDSGNKRSEVLDDYADGVIAGVYGTPTFFFNGYRVAGAIPADIFESILDTFLEGKN